MKKALSLILAAAMVLGLCACGDTKTPESTSPETTTNPAAPDSSSVIITEGINFKVGIMSNPVSQSEEAYRSAERLQKKYGEDVIVIDTFPDKAVAEQETTISKVMAMAADPDMKVIVFNQAMNGTIAAINKLKEKRPDIFCIACNTNEDADQVAAVADMLISKDHIGLGRQVAQRAVDAGAKTFIHYSFPRHMSNQIVAIRTQVMEDICNENGIKFMNVTAPDPQGDAGVSGAQQFILEDVPIKVKEYGKDTMFFTTNIAMNEPLVKSVMEQGAIFGCQADPSPFDAYPAALGITVPEDKVGDADYMLEQISQKVAEAGMSGRMSTWTRSAIDMYMQGSVAYGIAHELGLTNETIADNPAENVMDLEYLTSIMQEIAGDGVQVSHYVNGSDHEYSHFFILLGALAQF